MKGITAEESIVIHRITYPTLYRHRDDVLNSLFCIIGTGYGWTERGTLEYRSVTGEEKTEKILQTMEGILDDSDHPPGHAALRLKALTGEMDFEENLDAIWGTMEENGEYEEIAELFRLLDKYRTPKRRWYPISEGFSSITTVPAIVREDWFDLAVETCRRILEMDEGEDSENNRAAAEASLEALREIARDRDDLEVPE